MRERTCLHCRKAPARPPLGLCRDCDDTLGVRTLYLPGRRPVRPVWWGDHLERLAERVRQHLPLFPQGGGDGLTGQSDER